MNQIVSLALSLILMVTMALSTNTAPLPTAADVSPVLSISEAPETVWDENEETILLTDGAIYGEGATEFTFVVSAAGKDTTVTVNTDATVLGEALTALDMIAGEDSDWGMYVKTVNGITADYSVDGTYWALYIDGEYAMTGVDSTEITAGSVYTFAVEGGEESAEEAAEEPVLFVTEDGYETILLTDGAVYGEGAHSFGFVVTDLDGNTATVTVNTDAETVGAALLDLKMIDGDDSDWGLYVMTVNGVTADYNADGHYWAFYVDGEYAMTGVDSTEITDGAVYSFIVE